MKLKKQPILAPRVAFLLHRLTLLFGVSLFFLAVHVVDDALTTGEPQQYGMSVAEFLFYAALIYLILPPIGLRLARRGSVIGLGIVALYAFQAMYGAGINHIRHLFGDFGGSKLLPSLLAYLGLEITDIRGYGLGTMLMGMAGLVPAPPHTHNLPSTLVAFINIALNAALLLFCGAAFVAWWQARRIQSAGAQAVEGSWMASPSDPSSASQETVSTRS